jgi:hypothetical protein
VKSSLAALALLCSSVTMASTVTMVTSTNAVANGDTFDVVLHADQFPGTEAAALGLTFDGALVSLNSIQLCTVALCGTASPFDTLTQLINGLFSVAYAAAGFICDSSYPTAPFNMTPCNFDAVRFNFTAAASGNGAANIQLVDDCDSINGTLGWQEIITLNCMGGTGSVVPRPTYVQANVQVGVPAPAAAWLFGSGLGLLGVVRRCVMV